MQRYWEVVEEEEAKKLKWAPGPGITVGHYLPAYFVLKPVFYQVHILELQSQEVLDAEELGRKCEDGDCCSQEGVNLQSLDFLSPIQAC